MGMTGINTEHQTPNTNKLSTIKPGRFLSFESCRLFGVWCLVFGGFYA
jgi:hypothetical protein